MHTTLLQASSYSTPLDRRFCVAPMMDWTDRHCRYLLRLIYPHALLYTEMITTGALLYGDRKKFLQYDIAEHPLALQLGGSEPAAMAECARIAEDWGYGEVNINVGCPSDRVQSGKFGACLMAEPLLVAECVDAMRKVVNIPVTVKTRIGIDDKDSYSELVNFIQTVVAAGCDTFIIHARKAWLKGLSPKQNREIPPLNYAVVERIKCDFPTLTIVINGGFKTVPSIMQQLEILDGVMVGREAYQNPFSLYELNQKIFQLPAQPVDRIAIVEKYIEYIRIQLAAGVYLKHMTRHMLGLFQGVPGAKQWRRILSEQAVKPGADTKVVLEALSHINQEVL